MGRFQSASNPDDPTGTNVEAAAAKDGNGQPVSNDARGSDARGGTNAVREASSEETP
jgi:hypothetical protein